MRFDQLPIANCLNDIQSALHQADQAILEAPPGAGKTTAVPLALLDAAWLQHQKILLLEPRRLAALNAAHQMARLLGEPIGRRIGYRMRQATLVSEHTQIEVITEGLLLRMLIEDPALSGVGLVIFDEFHERNLHSDTGLALLLQARELFREESPLKILVMSATLATDALKAYLAPAPHIRSDGRSYPVTIRYCPPTGNSTLPSNSLNTVSFWSEAIQRIAEDTQGDILVFAPGLGEIQRLMSMLRDKLPASVQLLTLHGNLSLEAQSRALDPYPGFRKLVLATDIAETSLTIEGICVVVDLGLCRSPVFDPNTGISRLQTQTASQASATQRAGRAGRLGPGLCYRLWRESDTCRRVAFAPPEISESDLMPLALSLFAWGIQSPSELRWLTAPPAAHWQQACDALKRLALLDAKAQLTPRGTQVSKLPLHPRLGQLLLSAEAIGHGRLGAQLAAILSEKPPRELGEQLALALDALTGTAPQSLAPWQKRLRQLARDFERQLQTLGPSGSSRGPLSHAHLSRSSLDNSPLNSSPLNSSPLNNELITIEQIASYCVACAFPERIAQRRRQTADQAIYLLANGRQASLPLSSPLAREPWLAVADVGGDNRQTQDRIFLALPLSPRLFETLLADWVATEQQAEWDETTGRFVVEEQQSIGAILWRRRPLPQPDPTIKRQALLARLRQKGLQSLHWSPEAIQLRGRVTCLHRLFGGDWPDWSNDDRLFQALTPGLEPLLDSVEREADFHKLPLLALLQAQLAWPLSAELDRLAPETLAIPSGRQAKLDYSGEVPLLAVKLQEMFGCETSPAIARGRQPVLIHLLSPAGHPLQITQDLATFWRTGYDAVKKEMRGRYPRHPWPDNPLATSATAKTNRALRKEQE